MPSCFRAIAMPSPEKPAPMIATSKCCSAVGAGALSGSVWGCIAASLSRSGSGAVGFGCGRVGAAGSGAARVHERTNSWYATVPGSRARKRPTRRRQPRVGLLAALSAVNVPSRPAHASIGTLHARRIALITSAAAERTSRTSRPCWIEITVSSRIPPAIISAMSSVSGPASRPGCSRRPSSTRPTSWRANRSTTASWRSEPAFPSAGSSRTKLCESAGCAATASR